MSEFEEPWHETGDLGPFGSLSGLFPSRKKIPTPGIGHPAQTLDCEVICATTPFWRGWPAVTSIGLFASGVRIVVRGISAPPNVEVVNTTAEKACEREALPTVAVAVMVPGKNPGAVPGGMLTGRRCVLASPAELVFAVSSKMARVPELTANATSRPDMGFPSASVTRTVRSWGEKPIPEGTS